MATANLKSKISLDDTQFSAGLRRVKLTTAAAAKQIGTSFKAVGGSITNARKSLTKFAAIAGSITFAAAVAGAAKLTKSSLALAAKIEGIEVTMANFVGGTAEARKILKEISKFSTVTPFETTGLQEVVNLLLGAGIAAKDAVPVMKELAAVSKDTGQVAELGDAIAKGFAKGKFQTEELNKFLERGINLMPQLEKVTGKTGEELKKAIQAGLGFDDVREAIARMSQEGGLFFGMLEKQSTTTTGLISTLKSNWDELLTAFGRPINDALKPLLNASIEKLKELTGMAQGIGEIVAGAIGKITSAAAAGNWSDILELLNLGIEVVGENLGNVLRDAMTKAAEVFGSEMDEQLKILARKMDFLNLYRDEGEQDDFRKWMDANYGGGRSFSDDSKVMPKAGGSSTVGPTGKQMSEAERAFWEKWNAMAGGAPPSAPSPSGSNYTPRVSAADKAFDGAFRPSPHYEPAGPPVPKDYAKRAQSKSLQAAVGAGASKISPQAQLQRNALKMSESAGAGFMGLAGYYGMQVAKGAGIGPGQYTALTQGPRAVGGKAGAISRGNLNGLGGGLGAVRKVGAKADATAARRDETIGGTNKRLEDTNNLLTEQNGMLQEALA